MRTEERLGERATGWSRARGRPRNALTWAGLVWIAAVAACATPARSRASEAPGASIALSIEGHESLSTGEVERILLDDRSVLPGEAVLEARVDSLLRRLADAGRPFARADLEWVRSDEGLRLTLRLDEGPELRASDVVYRGSDSIDRELLAERAAVRAGGRLSRRAVERDVEAILTTYEDSGHPFAAVKPVVGPPSPEGSVPVVFEIDEGPEIRFGGLAVSGNTVTRRSVLERESGIVPGERYSASVVSRLRPRLERLGYFSSVSDPRVAIDSTSSVAIVGVEVKEASASRITGVLGYAPSGDDDRITGLVDVRLANIAGTGREAEVRWQRLRPGYTQTSFAYTEPWLLGAPIDVGVRGGQVVRDTLYTTTEADLTVAARMGERVRVIWSLGAERYVSGVPGDATTTSYRTAIGASYDGSDVPVNPSRGARLEGSIEYSAKEGGAENERSGVFTVGGELYVPLRPRHVLALVARLSAISSTEEEIPLHELLTLGGASSLRGYREEQFRGERTALGSVEYRLLLTRMTRAIAFVDAGYYFRGGSNSAKDVKLGYGIGLRGQTRLGIIALDYGLGEGDSPKDGKLHVGLIREF